MKKVLIYVLSAEMGPYPALREAAVATWDAHPLEGTETLYYSASSVPSAGVMVNIPIQDGIFEMGRKDLAAYKWALENREWDYMARVNSSCYTRKNKVLDIVQKLPGTGVFRGVGGPGPGNRRYLWGGAQYIMSRDVVAAMVLHGTKWDHTQMEDVAMCRLVEELGFKPDENGDACSLNEKPDHWLCIRYGGMPSFEFKTFYEMAAQIGDCPFIRVKQDGNRERDKWLMQQLYKHGI